MITKHSIDMRTLKEPCFAYDKTYTVCKVLIRKHEKCGSHKCPFYKPSGCKGWVKVIDSSGTFLIPPEDWYDFKRRIQKREVGYGR